MSEEIVNLQNIPNRDKSQKNVLVQGISSVDFEKFTRSVDSNFSTITSLIVTNNSHSKRVNKILNTIKNAAYNTNTILSSIDTRFGAMIQKINKNKSETTKPNTKPKYLNYFISIQNSLSNQNILLEDVIDKISGAINSKHYTQEVNPVINFTQDYSAILSKLDKTISILDLINSKQYTQEVNPVINFTQDYSTILSKLDKTISILDLINSKHYTQEVNPVIDITQNYESIIKYINKASDNVTDVLNSILYEIKNKDIQSTYSDTQSPYKEKSNKQKSYSDTSSSGKFNMNEIRDIIETVKLINPVTAKLFSNSFNIIARGIANGIAILEGSIGNDLSKFDDVGKILNSITSIIDLSGTETVSKIFGKEFKSSTTSVFTKNNAKRFAESFNIITAGITHGLNTLDNNLGSKQDIQQISERLSILSDIQNLINNTDLPITKVVAFRFKMNHLISTITDSFIDIRNMKVPTERKIEQLNNAILSLTDMVDVLNNIKFKRKNVKALLLFVDGIISSLEGLGKKSKMFERGVNTLISGITKIVRAFNILPTRKFKSINLLAAGIGMLGLSLFAFALLTPAIAVAAVGIMGFGLALKFITNTKSLFDIGIFTLSLATLGLSIWAFGEIVNMKAIGSTVLALGTLAATMWLFSGRGSRFMGIKGGIGPAPYKNMLWVALGIAALAGGIYVWQKLNIETESVLQVVAGAGAMAIMAWSFQRVNPKSLLMMVATGLSVAALGLSISVWERLNISWDIIGKVAVGGATMAAIAGIFSFVPITGPINMALVGGGMAALGWGLSKFPTNFGLEDYLTIGGFITALGLSTYLYANPIALVGAGVMVTVGASVVALAHGMEIISKTNIDKNKIDTFIYSTNSIVDSYSHMGVIQLGKAAAKAVLLIPVITSSISSAIALRMIMAMDYDSQKIDRFGGSVNSLVDVYENFGIIQLGKTALKATALLPIIAGTTLAATAIRITQALKIDPLKIKDTSRGMKLFIDEMVDTFSSIGPKMKHTRDGIKSVAGLAGTIKSLAEVVHMMSKMEYVESKIVDGKIVPGEVKKLSEKDFILVGEGIGKMLNSLIDPLVAIGSTQSTYKLGGLTIQNPFASGNKVAKGIKALSNIGSIFTPLTEIIKSFTDGGFFGETTKDPAKIISDILGRTINSIADGIEQLNKIKRPDKKKIESIETIMSGVSAIIKSITITPEGEQLDTDHFNIIFDKLESLFNTVVEFDSTGIKEFTSEITKLYTMIGDSKPWDKFEKNIKSQAKQFGIIKKEINGLDLQKSIILRDLTKNIKDANDNQNIARLVQEINRMIGIVESQQQSQEQHFNHITNNQSNTHLFTPNKIATDNTKQIGQDEIDLLKDKIKELESQVQSGANNSQLKTSMDNIANILTSRTLSVKISEF